MAHISHEVQVEGDDSDGDELDRELLQQELAFKDTQGYDPSCGVVPDDYLSSCEELDSDEEKPCQVKVVTDIFEKRVREMFRIAGVIPRKESRVLVERYLRKHFQTRKPKPPSKPKPKRRLKRRRVVIDTSDSSDSE